MSQLFPDYKTSTSGSQEIEAENNNEVSQLTAALAGIGSGLIKIPEGFVSLGAEIMDATGITADAAAKVEQVFDKINPLEEIAEQRAAGKLTQMLVQVGVPAGIGAKIATKMATKALKAKKAGRYVNLKSKNFQKGLKKAQELSTSQKIGAVALGGAGGELMVADVEDIGTIGDAFEAGPTELDRNVDPDASVDARRKLLNRLKFSAEGIPLTGLVYGTGLALRDLGRRGKEMAYSNDKLQRLFDKVGSYFRPRGSKPQEVFLGLRKEKGRLMADTNYAMEQVKRIDKEVNQMFPYAKSFLNKTTDENRGKFLKEINDLMFSGDLKNEIPEAGLKNFMKVAKKMKASNKNINNLLTSVRSVRNKFSDLMDITAQGPVGMTAAAGKKLQVDLRALMGDRVKNYLGTTYKIFQNTDYSFYQRYKPTDEAVFKAKELFKRYAAKNKNPITDEEAEMLVNDVLKQARAYNPKSKLPTFEYDNLAQGASTPTNIKTFAQTLTKELPDGSKELQVIGKGSKIFRELFGEVEDARHSIFEGMNRLGTIARKNQLFDEILDVDAALKEAATSTTPPGSRGFFFSDRLAAKRALPNQEIVKIDPYVQEYFTDGVLINRLQGSFTSKDIAEAFGNASKVSQFMRGEAGNKFARTASYAYRNLFLTPKAGSQYAKTVLSIPTHFRNFFSSSAFALANGALSNPILMVRGFNTARKTLNLGLRDPKAMEYYRELLELGVTNTNTRMGDLQNLMRDAKIFESGNIATDSILKPMMRSLGKVGASTVRGARKLGKGMQDAYIAEDDFWKITMYEVEKLRRAAKYASAGIKRTPQQLKEEAADIVRNTIPNYAYVGDFVRTMRATPFGNFMSWPSEIFRTGGGIFETILKDIRDPVTGSLNYFKSTNPMKSIGLSRAVGASTAMAALPYGIVKGAQAIFGVSDEEAAAATNLGVAPWSKNSQNIFVRDPETGELFYSDWSHNNVYDTLTRPFQTLVRNIQEGIESEDVLSKGFYKGLTESAAETANPFIGESIFTEAFNDIWFRKGRTKEGKQLYTEQTPRNEKWSRILKHLAETQAPQYKQFVRVYDSATGKPDSNGDVIEIPKSLAGVFGFRLIKIDPQQALGYKINQYQGGLRNARKEFTGGEEGVIKVGKTPEDVIERYYVANEALFKVKKQMAKDIRDGKTLGLSDGFSSDLFRKRGLKKDYNALINGSFDPYYPSKGTINAFYDLAKRTNQPDHFKIAQPIINMMNNAFSKMSLNDEWTFTLADFMPPQGTYDEDDRVKTQVPPLPEQPQPNKQVINPNIQPNVMEAGLTAVEQGLLSEEEKMIKLRQRGLA